MPYITSNLDQIEYVVGIDFGHGETSAAYCSLDSNTISPINVELASGRYSIPSAICITTDNTSPILGYQAATEKRRNPEGVFDAYFKNAPQLLTDEKRNVISKFMKAIYEEIRSKTNSILKDGNHVVFIACPSASQKWDENAMREYVEIAADAGLPIFKANAFSTELLGIIRESRAAFLQLIQDTSSDALPKSCVKNVLVIDFGSSTIDITYHEEGMPPIDKSYDYGAQLVEKGIYDHLMNIEEKVIYEAQLVGVKSNLRILKESFSSSYPKTIFDIRRQKESYYSGDSDCMEISIRTKEIPNFQFERICGLDIHTDKRIEAEIYKEDLDKILKDSGYIQCIEKCFKDYYNEFLVGKKISLLVVTGGASRMPFVREIAERIFRQEGTVFPPVFDPSLSVSRGLACAGKCDVNLYRLAEDLKKSNKVRNVDSILSNVINKAKTKIVDKVFDCISVDYYWFKNRSVDTSINELKSEIKKDLSKHSYIDIINEIFNNELKNYVDGTTKHILENFTALYFPYFETKRISDCSISNLSKLKISVEKLSAIESAVNKSEDAIIEGLLLGVAKLIQGVGATAIGTVMATGAAISNAGVWAASKLGVVKTPDKHYIDIEDTFEYVLNDLGPKFRDKDTKLDSKLRSKVYQAFCDGKSDYKSKLEQDIKFIIESYDDLKRQINENASKFILEYIDDECKKIHAQLN